MNSFEIKGLGRERKAVLPLSFTTTKSLHFGGFFVLFE
jgi:hypothetical protein